MATSPMGKQLGTEESAGRNPDTDGVGHTSSTPVPATASQRAHIAKVVRQHNGASSHPLRHPGLRENDLTTIPATRRPIPAPPTPEAPTAGHTVRIGTQVRLRGAVTIPAGKGVDTVHVGVHHEHGHAGGLLTSITGTKDHRAKSAVTNIIRIASRCVTAGRTDIVREECPTSPVPEQTTADAAAHIEGQVFLHGVATTLTDDGMSTKRYTCKCHDE